MESEDGAVLKLVHPGRFVEIHRKPLTAGEVMARNPRHFVTRPDVFRFPWVVVRPESLLIPGNVFYIVPCHTLYRLVQTSRRDGPSSPRMSDRRRYPDDGAVTYSDFDSQVFDVDGGAGGLREQQPCELKPCLKKGNSNPSSSSASTRRGGGCRRVAFTLPKEDDEKN